MGTAAVSARPLRKWAFHLATRPAAWLMRSINGLVAMTTHDRPFHPREAFDWAARMEARHPGMRAEVDELTRYADGVPRTSDFMPSTQYYYDSPDWRQLMFYFGGVRIQDICELYPNIDAALREVPGLVSATVSFLAPHERIPAHTHFYKGLLIFHIGMVVPPGGDACAIRVGQEARPWKEGEVFVIDPTFDHEVWNRTDQRRIVILGEFRRPDLPRALRFLDLFYLLMLNVSPVGRNMLGRIREFAARHRAEVLASRGL
jgi:beta-hydroxylase